MLPLTPLQFSLSPSLFLSPPPFLPLSLSFSLPAPSVLCERGGHPERPQPDQHLHGWEDVFLEPGHALSAPGTAAAALLLLWYWSFWYWSFCYCCGTGTSGIGTSGTGASGNVGTATVLVLELLVL